MKMSNQINNDKPIQHTKLIKPKPSTDPSNSSNSSNKNASTKPIKPHSNRTINNNLKNLSSPKHQPLPSSLPTSKSSHQLLTQSISFISSFSDDEDVEEESNSSDKMKNKINTKLLTMWNNVKYGWTIKFRPTFNLNNEPIWLLGVCYLRADKQHYLRQLNLIKKSKHNLDLISLNDDSIIKTNLVDENQSTSSSSHSSQNTSPSSSELDLLENDSNVIASLTSSDVLESFKHDFYSRIWMTYRRDFKKIPGSSFRSDSGWGCMLRSGQMMLAQAFLYHYLPRNWRFGAKSDKEDMIHRMLIKWFHDDNNSIQSPFSIHQLVKSGLNFGKKPGDWYGPNSVSYILKDALESSSNSNFVLDSVCMYVAQDCTIYLKDLIKLCTKRNQPSKYKSLSALKKDKTNCSNNYNLVNNGTYLNSLSYLKSRKRIRSSLKSLGSSIDLASDLSVISNNKSNKDSGSSSGSVGDKNGLSSAESNASRNNSVNQSIDDVFTKSTLQNLIDGKSSSSFNLGETVQLSNQLTKKNLSTDSSASSNSSTRSSKSSSSKTKRHSTSSILLNELKKSTKKNKWKSVIILIPLRLGGEKFNSIYTNCIKKLFKSPYCIGIIGGKPKHSLYFVGCHDDHLVYLDPHYLQETINTSKTNFPLDSYHCSTPRKLPINKIDPSLTVGFYCKTEQDLDNLIQFTRKEIVPSKQKINNQQYPVFIFDEVNSMSNNNVYCEDLNLKDDCLISDFKVLNKVQQDKKDKGRDKTKPNEIVKDKLVKVRHRYLNKDGELTREIESGDFVLL